MKGYVFSYGSEYCEENIPAFEEGCYLDFDAAFAHLVELNNDIDENILVYEEGYGEDYYPEDDLELAKAEEEEDWDKYELLIEKHRLTNINDICKQCVNTDPPFGMYALWEIEIKK